MATNNWLTERPIAIEETLYTAGQRIEFYQAVRLLEISRSEAAGVGETADAYKEPVRFQAEVNLASAASPLHSASYGSFLFATDVATAEALDRGVMPQALYTQLTGQLIQGPTDRKTSFMPLGLDWLIDLTMRLTAFEVVPIARGQLWKLLDLQNQRVYFVARHDHRLHVHDGRQTMLRVNVLGLAGSAGPLPDPFTELILDRLRQGDGVLRDFLDIFNNRLLALQYRVHKIHRVGFEPVAPGQDRFSRYLFALLGLGTAELRERLLLKKTTLVQAPARASETSLQADKVLNDRVLLPYAGLLGPEQRSAAGLLQLLRDHFKIDVALHAYQGRWLDLAETDWTAIGLAGRNQRLGNEFVLGQQVYDVASKFELRLGPLPLTRFKDFLPVTEERQVPIFAQLCQLTRFYVRQLFDFDVRLSLQAAEVPGWHLGSGDSLLGWLTWLKTQPFASDDEQLVLGAGDC